MNENNGRELVPQRGPPGEISERREYTVNMARERGVNPRRKKDWLDYVGAFLEDPYPKPDKSFRGFLRACKTHPVLTTLELMPLVGLVAVGTFCAMDTYHWDWNKAGDDFMHAIPGGSALDDFVKGAAQPAYRPRPGETADVTQRRRDCLTAVIEHSDDRHIIAHQKFPRRPLDFCETPEGLTPSAKSGARTR